MIPLTIAEAIPNSIMVPVRSKRKAVRGLIEYEEADMSFVMYDVDVELTDYISYGGSTYQVVGVPFKNESSGRCVVKGKKI